MGMKIIHTKRKYMAIEKTQTIVETINAAKTKMDIGSIKKNLDHEFDQTEELINLNNFSGAKGTRTFSYYSFLIFSLFLFSYFFASNNLDLYADIAFDGDYFIIKALELLINIVLLGDELGFMTELVILITGGSSKLSLVFFGYFA